jgi:hypothetical protein
MTPGTLSKSASTHQKQPAANVAVATIRDAGFPDCGDSVRDCAAVAGSTPTNPPRSHT